MTFLYLSSPTFRRSIGTKFLYVHYSEGVRFLVLVSNRGECEYVWKWYKRYKRYKSIWQVRLVFTSRNDRHVNFVHQCPWCFQVHSIRSEDQNICCVKLKLVMLKVFLRLKLINSIYFDLLNKMDFQPNLQTRSFPFHKLEKHCT